MIAICSVKGVDERAEAAADCISCGFGVFVRLGTGDEGRESDFNLLGIK